MPDFLFLDEQTTASMLTMQDVVETCEGVLGDLGRGEGRLSEPAAMFLEGDRDAPTLFKVKGGMLPTSGACGFRVVGDVGPDGAGSEHHFCYLVDPETARPRALVAQTEIHRMRTAACGLVALRHLAVGAMETVALVGAGRIGRHFAAGFHDVFPGRRLLISSRRVETARGLAGEVAGPSRLVEAASMETAMASSQGIVALTSSRVPVLPEEAMRPGMTIVGMGEHHELSVGMLHRADRFVVDDLGFASVLGSLSAWLGSGELGQGQAAARLDATLGAVVSGRAEGRRGEGDAILAIVQGLAVADLALAELCRQRASRA